MKIENASYMHGIFRFYDSQLIQQPCVNLRLTLIFHGYFAPLRLLKFNGV